MAFGFYRKRGRRSFRRRTFRSRRGRRIGYRM